MIELADPSVALIGVVAFFAGLLVSDWFVRRGARILRGDLDE